MITKQVIDELYRKYNKRPPTPYDLNLGLLFDHVVDTHSINLNEEKLIIGSIPEDALFHEIMLDHIHEIVEFENTIAIVLHSSILFLDKHDNKSYIHLRSERPSLWERVRNHLPL